MADATFTCAVCGKTFDKLLPEEEALAEFARLFPADAIEDAAVVCEDCWESLP